jgi:hypothetical protein
MEGDGSHAAASRRVPSGTRLAVGESDEGLVLTPLKPTRSARRQAGWRSLRGSAKGTNRLALRGTRLVSMKDATRRRVRRAAELKSKHAIAYADAFAVATAVEFNAVLLTGDPEIEPIEGEQHLEVEWLPRKS